jgi:spermidine/putrescine transport system ATP-binding protein
MSHQRSDSRASGPPIEESALSSRESGKVSISGISKRFGKVFAVREVSLTISGGEFFSLLGPSGCGKTTLLRILSGFERPDEGTIHVGDQRVDGIPPNRRPTAMVFQRWALFPHLTVLENICYGLRVKRTPHKTASARANELIELVGLTGLSDRKPAQLSGGQQQRVALARSLAIEPKVLLLDEPLSSLDLRLRDQMRIELKRLQRELGTTFIYVTHDQGEAMTMSDHVAVMQDGRVLQVGSPQSIYDNPTSAFVASFIGDTNLIDSQAPEAVIADTGRLAAMADGSRYLSIRYERLQIGSNLATDILFPVKIIDVSFAGPRVRYRVQVEGREIELFADVAYQGDAHLLARGDKVLAGWQHGAAVPVADS